LPVEVKPTLDNSSTSASPKNPDASGPGEKVIESVSLILKLMS